MTARQAANAERVGLSLAVYRKLSRKERRRRLSTVAELEAAIRRANRQARP